VKTLEKNSVKSFVRGKFYVISCGGRLVRANGINVYISDRERKEHFIIRKKDI
jgi:hypothetical protein